jgi:hypothetical protein
MLTFLDEEKKAADQSGRRRAQPVAQPNHAAVEHFVARESHAFDRGGTGVDVAGVENTGSARAAIDDRTDDKAEFVDEAGAQERTIGPASTLQQDAFDAEFGVERLERPGKINSMPRSRLGGTCRSKASSCPYSKPQRAEKA